MFTLCEFRVDFKAVYFIIASTCYHKHVFNLISMDLVWLEHDCSLHKHGSILIAEEMEREIIMRKCSLESLS